MPTDEELDAMALKLTGATFAAQPGPHEKARIMELAIAAKSAEHLERLDKGQDDIIESMGKLVDSVENIASDSEHVGQWFKHSKLWEGRLD